MPKINSDSKTKPANKNTRYRDERGVRKHEYRRFEEGVDFEVLDKSELSNMIDMIQERNKRRSGRPRKLADVEDFLKAVDEYWTYIRTQNDNGYNLIPDVEGFCTFIGIDRSTLWDWEKSRDSEYSNEIKKLKNDIAFCKKQLALTGKIPPIVFATDFNNNHGYVQKQEPQLVLHARPDELRPIEELQRLLLTQTKTDLDE